VVGGHGGGVVSILEDVDPLAPLRTVRGRLAPQMEARAQVITERVITLVLDSLDLNAIIARIDLNAVLARVDIEEPIDRIQINEVLGRVDLNSLLSRVDLNAVVERVDVEEPIDRIQINEVLDRIDLNGLLDRVDINALAQRLDVEALVANTDLGSVIAKSSSGIASGVVDAVRSRTVGMDESIARLVARLRRRPYTGPPGPPAGLQVTAAS